MVKLLLFSKKRIIPLLVALCMIVSFCSAPTVSYAKTWTKSSIKKEISAKQKKYNSIKKKYNKEVKKAKNTIALITAEKLSSSPLVCYNDGFLGIGRGYYYIIGGKKNLLTYPSVSGSVKPTGKTKKWGGHTCTVCKGVKLKSSTYKKQMDKLKEQIKELKSALNYEPMFYKESICCDEGEEIDLYDEVAYDKYNDLKGWKSSDTSVASISSLGNLKAKKPGKCTVSVKGSVSGKTSKIEIIVEEKTSKRAIIDEEYQYYVFGDENLNATDDNLIDYIKQGNSIYGNMNNRRNVNVGDQIMIGTTAQKNGVESSDFQVTYEIDENYSDSGVAKILYYDKWAGIYTFTGVGVAVINVCVNGSAVGSVWFNVTD